MQKLTREMCWRAYMLASPRVDCDPVGGPLQTGMGKCPWRVAVASVLLCRTRGCQARPVMADLLSRWPTAAHLARAEGLEEVVRPCGLHRNRARQLVRFSNAFLGEGWTDLEDLPGVGRYVNDAVGLFVFSYTDLDSGDVVLHEYARRAK